jgi:hypothetical protein
MLEAILRYFPTHTHPLTVVSDPDGLLLDAELEAALTSRGFWLVREADPVALRYAVEQARPWSAARPLVVSTADALNTLPYDLWQAGHGITLSLGTLFPTLA